MRRFIVFAGPKGSGKSTLIRQVLGLSVVPDEPDYYRVYELRGNVVVAELSGRKEAQSVLSYILSRWNIEHAILVLDASRPRTIDEYDSFSEPLRLSKMKCVVLNKVDACSRDLIKCVEKVANTLNATFFATSCLTGEGIDALSSWLGARVERPSETYVGRIVPSLKQPYTYNIKRDSDRLGLTDMDLKILRLVDGKKDVDEISRALGLLPFSVMIRLRRIEARGLVSLKIVV